MLTRDFDTADTILEELDALVKRRNEIDRMIEFLERLERPGEHICYPLDRWKTGVLN